MIGECIARILAGAILSTTPPPPATYEDVAPIIQAKCAACHFGAALDLSSYPFYYYKTDDQQEIVRAMMERVRLAADDWLRMPTRNAPGLAEAEMRLMESWAAGVLSTKR